MVFLSGVSTAIVAINEWTLNGTEESLCITNDAKVGVGIANPQRSLEIAGDLVAGGTVSAGNPLMYRNRIINGDMRIAQRGTSAATSTGYLIDRWTIEQISGSGIQSQTLLAFSDTPYNLGFKYATNVFVTSSSTGLMLAQKIENVNITDFNWGTSQGVPVTVSLWYKTNATPGSIIPISIRTALYIGSVYWQVYPYNTVAIGQNTWQYVSFTVPPSPNVGYTLGLANNGGQDQLQLYIGPANGYSTTAVAGTWTQTSAMGSTAQTNIWNTPGNYLLVTGVQLEKGTVATPFEVRPYATELQLCQRYFQQLGGQMFNNYFGTGLAYNTSSAYILCPLNVQMRAPASSTVAVINVASISLLGNVSGSYGTTTLSAIAKDQQNINNIELGVTSSSANLIPAFPYMMYTSSANTPFIQINNEL